MNDFLLLLTRHGLALLGGLFASHGISIGEGATTDIIAGLILVGLAVVLSSVSKWFKLDDQLGGCITTNQQVRILIGAVASQAVTALSAYFAVDANRPELLAGALVNAGLSKAGFHQSLALGKSAVQALAVCGSLLMLSSCAQWTQFMSSPTGKTTVALSKLGLDLALERNQVSPGNIIQINKALAVVTDPSNRANDMVYKLGEIGLDAAINNKLVKDGDVLTIQKATAIIESAVDAPAVPAVSGKNPSGKQPVNPVTPAVSMREPGCLRLVSQASDGRQECPPHFRHAATPANDAQGDPAMPPVMPVMKHSGGGVSKPLPLYGAAVAALLASR